MRKRWIVVGVVLLGLLAGFGSISYQKAAATFQQAQANDAKTAPIDYETQFKGVRLGLYSPPGANTYTPAWKFKTRDSYPSQDQVSTTHTYISFLGNFMVSKSWMDLPPFLYTNETDTAFLTSTVTTEKRGWAIKTDDEGSVSFEIPLGVDVDAYRLPATNEPTRIEVDNPTLTE